MRTRTCCSLRNFEVEVYGGKQFEKTSQSRWLKIRHAESLGWKCVRHKNVDRMVKLFSKTIKYYIFVNYFHVFQLQQSPVVESH